MDDAQGSCCKTVWKAIFNRHVDCFKRLFSSVNECDYFDATLLHEAVNSRSMEILTILIDSGANVNAKTKTGYTPLRFAVDQKIAHKLIVNGACSTSFNQQNYAFERYSNFRTQVSVTLWCKYSTLAYPDVVRHIGKHLWSMRLDFLNLEEEDRYNKH